MHESVGNGNSPENDAKSSHPLFGILYSVSLMTGNHPSPASMVHAITKLESQPKK